MWVIFIEKKRTEGMSAEDELKEFAGAVFAHTTKRRVFAALPLDAGDLTVEALQEIIANPSLIPGSGQLKWFQPGLEADIRRTIDAAEAREDEKTEDSSQGADRIASLIETLFGDALKGGRLKKGIPPELAEKLRAHHKSCGKPGCPVPRPPEEKAEGKAEIKAGDLVRWVDSSSFKRAGRAIRPFPKKTPFSELPPSAVKLTDDLLIGVNRLAEFSHHDRFLVEMVEGGEIVYAVPRVDMLTVVNPGEEAKDPEGAHAQPQTGRIVRVGGYAYAGDQPGTEALTATPASSPE